MIVMALGTAPRSISDETKFPLRSSMDLVLASRASAEGWLESDGPKARLRGSPA
jgi:hypothetical protein